MPAATSLPPHYPRDWEHNVALRDGTTVRIRPIQPQDAAGLQQMVSRMSRQSVYHRFFQVKTHLVSRLLQIAIVFTEAAGQRKSATLKRHSEHTINTLLGTQNTAQIL